MNERDLKSQLDKRDITPSRKLGQSFLVDENTSRWIANQLEIEPHDHVVEVGPGFGALTQHLVERTDRLTLIEKDGRLADYLRDTYGPDGVEVIHADATEFDVRQLFLSGPIKFIGNLPYSAASEILRIFMDAPSPVEQAVIMVQKEMADRLAAVPRTKAYGALSLLLQHRWEIFNLKTIGPSVFHPRPEIDSSILKFIPRSETSLPDHSPEAFVNVVKQGFSQRRKQLHNNLPIDRSSWDEVASKLGLSKSSRAEELALEDWLRLSSEVHPHPCADLPPSAEELLDVVNERDEVVEQRKRCEIHAEGLTHRAVHVFLFN
ncbi:MAG: 16S rRNA (adenine(1518)-N(6)/adenine(1519)-N(6))-dimethyltransferase RsmA, partial [Verrucomicrobiota bacterium]